MAIDLCHERALHGGGNIASIDEGAELPIRGPLRGGISLPPHSGSLIGLRLPHSYRPQTDRGNTTAAGEACAQILAQDLGHAIWPARPTRVCVVLRQVVRKSLAFCRPEDLSAGEVKYLGYARCLRGQQDMPGSQHVHSHDLLRRSSCVMGEGREVDDRGAAHGRPSNGVGIEDVLAVGNIEADDLVTLISQVRGYDGADIAPLAGDENAHADNDPLQPS